MSVNIVVDINANEISGNINTAIQHAIPEFTEYILGSSNDYCPLVEAGLFHSSSYSTDVDSGKLIWNTPYARYLYYGVLMVGENGAAWARSGEKKHIAVPEKALTYNQSSHPQAQALWFEKAKDVHIKEWEKAFENGIKEWL